jgi:hypothetical protein
VAEHLAVLSGQTPSAWCLRPEYVLPEAIPKAANERTIADTPAALRKRNLFCGPALMKLFAVLPA